MTRVAPRRALIVTADDFGLHKAVNEAVEQAHREGLLTAASLMVGAPAADDAVERARRLPGLRVGLHLVLADGPAFLPPEAIPDLVDADGNFGNRMALDGFRFFFLPHVRRQLAAEIRAQFAVFAATRIPLDHVNTHKHFHLHPTVLSLILAIGRDFGLRAVRLPHEPRAPIWMRPWLALMRRRLDRSGIAHNHRVFGIERSGAMDETALLEIAERLPEGVSEIYLHPATESGPATTSTMAGYRHADELAALLSHKVRAAFDATGAARGGFADIFGFAARSVL